MDAGYQEVVLAGVHIGDYGADLEGQKLLDLLEAVDSGDNEYRNAALNLACDVPGKRFTTKGGKQARRGSREARADVLAMLERRGDVTALPVVFEALTLRSPEFSR